MVLGGCAGLEAVQGLGQYAAGRMLDTEGIFFLWAEKRSLLVKELQGLSMAQRDHMVRNMPLSLGEKRWLR